jgi:hypothetical protein
MINPSFAILQLKIGRKILEWFNIENLALLLILFVLITLSGFIYTALNIKYDKTKTEYTNSYNCRQVKRKQFIRNWTDYFWSNSIRFAWITLILLSIITYGITIAKNFNIVEGAYISVIFSIITFLFFIFSFISYKNFPSKAKAALDEFESAIKAGINKETTYDGDNIQRHSDESSEMDTKLTIFEFTVGPKKIDFPPFESRPPKKPIIEKRKLEFLVLSREYFNICQSATPFNLLNPEKLPAKKKCAPKKAAGPCKEYYYSQVKYVTYEEEHIMIFFNTNDETIKYSSPKRLGKHANVISAFREKLRITERQRLTKVDEHKKFIDIQEDKNTINENEEEVDEESE